MLQKFTNASERTNERKHKQKHISCSLKGGTQNADKSIQLRANADKHEPAPSLRIAPFAAPPLNLQQPKNPENAHMSA